VKCPMCAKFRARHCTHHKTALETQFGLTLQI
jgi:hypothetical protein